MTTARARATASPTRPTSSSCSRSPDIDSPQRILAEAERLFAAEGYAGASLSRIARAAGLGNAGLIHHYPSKAAVYRGVLETIGADLDRRTEAAMAAADTPAEQLRGLVDALLRLADERPTALLVIAQEFMDRSGRIEEAGTLPLAAVVRDTVAVLEAGQRDGTVRDGDPVAMTAALHGALVHGLLGRTVYARTSGVTPGDGWRREVAASALGSVLVPVRPSTGQELP